MTMSTIETKGSRVALSKARRYTPAMVRDRLLREERQHAEMARIYAAAENSSHSAMLYAVEREQAAFYLAAARLVASLVRTRKAAAEPTDGGAP